MQKEFLLTTKYLDKVSQYGLSMFWPFFSELKQWPTAENDTDRVSL
jgi:hypothetical protein